MRFLSSLVLCAFCLSLISSASSSSGESKPPRIEVFGGYSALHTAARSLSGWDTAASVTLNRFLGITADINGGFGTELSVPLIGGTTLTTHGTLSNFLFGPRFTIRTRRITPYAHALFGVSRFHNDARFLPAGPELPSVSEKSLGMSLGGGVDVQVAKFAALRVVQLDYLRTRFSEQTQNNTRVCGGVVLRF
jgi:hypothetical protein